MSISLDDRLRSNIKRDSESTGTDGHHVLALATARGLRQVSVPGLQPET